MFLLDGIEEEAKIDQEEDWRDSDGGSLGYTCIDRLEVLSFSTKSSPICPSDRKELVHLMTDGWRCSHFTVSRRRDLET